MNKSIVVKLDPKKVAANVGLLPGGKVHKYFMDRTAAYMEKYLPYRKDGSMVDKMMQGKNYEKSHFHFSGPHSSFLYEGKVMVGDVTGSAWAKEGETKHATSKNLNYTKSPHPKAGPHWGRQVQQNDVKAIAKEVEAYIKNRGGG